MSAQNSYSPKCIIAGEISPLAIALAKSLEHISCTPLFFPVKITAIDHNIGQANAISNQDLINYQIEGIRYIFYFAPESILSSESGYQEHFSLRNYDRAMCSTLNMLFRDALFQRTFEAQ